ncbi:MULTISPECIES: hypothetical protein [unclassified Pseudomonas]|uniref:hypothetical protein n=1 Tax=unclassified Pseudomonas TaxID=196821 RepID=UPI002448E3C5|nr:MULTISPECIES: hypothetical protein [unclassified Pseudomonas]MDH0894663.1 hypothetical protein [Pseudomonas sp. GD03875]MDH1067287.1 hypothetical protein [Pseudomonas sp. GD03985]
MHKQTPNWLTQFLIAFGAPGLVALAWWAGAFHAQRIRELQATYPILQITGPAGSGKTTLVSSLWGLSGSEPVSYSANTCSMGALLAFLARAVNRPVVIDESGYDSNENFDWNALRECYDGKPMSTRGTGIPAEGMRFQGALAFIGGEGEVLNRRIVNVHLPRLHPSEAQRNAIQALNELQVGHFTEFVETVRANTVQVAYRLGHVAAYVESMQEDMGPDLPTDSARNHAQLRALLDLLDDLFQVPDEALHQGHCFVNDMAWRHAGSGARL